MTRIVIWAYAMRPRREPQLDFDKIEDDLEKNCKGAKKETVLIMPSGSRTVSKTNYSARDSCVFDKPDVQAGNLELRERLQELLKNKNI